MNARWQGLYREWASGTGSNASMGRESLPVVECDRCGAIVAEDAADKHDRWHKRVSIGADFGNVT